MSFVFFKSNKKERLYLFTHIPKTAGTTLRVHFQKYMQDQKDFIHLANKGHKWAREKGLVKFYDRSQADRNQAKVILGHQVNYKTKELVTNKEVIELVFFRDPFEWEISRFNQYANKLNNLGKPVINFKQWVSEIEKTHSQIDWFLSRYLLLLGNIKCLNSRSKENLLFYTLQHFDHVSLVEDFDTVMKPVFDDLQVPHKPNRQNTVGKQKIQFFESTEENRALLNEICEPELEIYEKLKKFIKNDR